MRVEAFEIFAEYLQIMRLFIKTIYSVYTTKRNYSFEIFSLIHVDLFLEAIKGLSPSSAITALSFSSATTSLSLSYSGIFSFSPSYDALVKCERFIALISDH